MGSFLGRAKRFFKAMWFLLQQLNFVFDTTGNPYTSECDRGTINVIGRH